MPEKSKKEKQPPLPHSIISFNREYLIDDFTAFTISGHGGGKYLTPVILSLIEKKCQGAIIGPTRVIRDIIHEAARPNSVTHRKNGNVDFKDSNRLELIYSRQIVIDLSGGVTPFVTFALSNAALFNKPVVYIEDGPGHARDRLSAFHDVLDNLTILAYSENSAKLLREAYPILTGKQIVVTGRPDFDYVTQINCRQRKDRKKNIILAGTTADEQTLGMIDAVLLSTSLHHFNITLSLHPKSGLKVPELYRNYGKLFKIHTHGTPVDEIAHADLFITTGESMVTRLAGYFEVPSLMLVEDGKVPKMEENNAIITSPYELPQYISRYTENPIAVSDEKSRLQSTYRARLDGKSTQRVYDAIV